MTGEVTGDSTGGSAGRPGEVRRAAYGIPHVLAPTAEDVVYHQGRVTALDRTWQLEHGRWRAEGTTAARLGARGVPWDRFARRVQLAALARAAYDDLSAGTAAFVDAFVDGVNAGFQEAGPVAELEHLGVEPGRWQPWTPLAVFAAQHVLFGSLAAKLWRRHAERVVGRQLADLVHPERHAEGGSNAWVVGAARSASRRPLMAGDPHRVFEDPNVYQQVRLNCTDPDEGFDVVGLPFPGVPGVQHFAHAGQVAWAVTNAAADYQDVYVEELRQGPGDGGGPDDTIWARGPEGWYAAEVHTEQIEVRDAAPQHVVVIRTRNGLVLHGGPGVPETLSLRTAVHVRGDLGFEALPRLLRARSSAEVDSAFDVWVEPVNNVLIADVTDDVRHRVAGAVPSRPEENRWRPVPGSDAGHDWRGWVTDLPRADPGAERQIVSANERMTDDYVRIGVAFAAPTRAERIAGLLADRGDLEAEDFAAIHRDTLLGQSPLLLTAIAEVEGLSSHGRRLQRELAEWDRHMEVDSHHAAAYVAVRDALLTRLAASPELAPLAGECPYGPVFAASFSTEWKLLTSLANLLSTAGRALLPVEESLRAALEEVAATHQPGPWGEQHRFTAAHALGWRRDAALAEAPPVGGDQDCVHSTGAIPGSTTVFRGSVARYVWDLAGFDRSGWVVPLGAHGAANSPHAMDQQTPWLDGTMHAPGC